MDPTRLQSVLDNAVASGAVAGVAAAVLTPTGTVFEGTAGTLAVGNPAPVTPDTQFWIASMTKPITSIAAMQLVEAGRLSLDEPIGDLLPDLANPQILQNGGLRPATRRITLRHLLTHTAGFSYPFASADLTAYIAANKIFAPTGSLASLQMPLLFEPGERWEYGISTDWVGRAVEAASGQSLDQYFTRHITGPLGMENTAFVPRAQNHAAMHKRQADGELVVLPAFRPGVPEFCSGGGGLFSTLRDYQKFLAALLNGGAPIISPAGLAAMSTNQIGALRAGVIPTADPALMSNMDSFPGMDTKWSFGFLISPQIGPFGRSPFCLSWAGMANTYFWIDPAQKLAAVILMQILPSGDLGAMKTYWGFERAIYAAMR